MNTTRNGACIRPVFLISLPRSGSTLLQKMLAVSPEICTTAEPWILLPLASMLDPDRVVTEYWNTTCCAAIEDLTAELPRGREDFNELIHDFACGLYSKIDNGRGAKLFLDKTPRYYLIPSFLAEAFPEARFLFLMRHPIEVLASSLTTWHNGRFHSRLKSSYVDIVRGPIELAQGVRLLGDRAHVIHYSELVSNPEETLGKVCESVGIRFLPEMLTAYREVEFKGRMGDSTGVKTYKTISTDSMAKWKAFVNNPFRKRFALRYVDYLGDDVLRAFGIQRDELEQTIRRIPTSLKGTVSDLLGYGALTVSRVLNRISLGDGYLNRLRRKDRPWLPYG